MRTWSETLLTLGPATEVSTAILQVWRKFDLHQQATAAHRAFLARLGTVLPGVAPHSRLLLPCGKPFVVVLRQNHLRGLAATCYSCGQASSERLAMHGKHQLVTLERAGLSGRLRLSEPHAHAAPLPVKQSSALC